MSGPAPFGTKWADGKLVPDPGEIGTVRDLVEAFIAAGGRLKATAAALSAKGARTRRQSEWTDVAVARVLKTPGLRDLVTEDQWIRLAAILAEREAPGASPGRRTVHPLGGVVHCNCGKRMYLRGDGPTGKFVCRGCRAKIAQGTLERLFAETVSGIELDASEILEAIADNPQAAELNRSLGRRAVALSEVWPLLDPQQVSQFVDLLVDRIVVGPDEVSVVLAQNGDSTTKTTPSSTDSLPSSHGSDRAKPGATSRADKKPESEGPARRILEPKAYRVQHVAQLLNVPQSTVYDWVRTGTLASVRTGTTGGVVLVPASSVAEFLERKRRRK